MYAYTKPDYEELEVKTAILPWQELGLSFTASGYGKKIPTSYKVKYNNRWKRVYSICYSNVSTEYIIEKGKRVLIDLSRYPM